MVSVTRNGAWREEYIRSARWETAHGPRTTQPIGPAAMGGVVGVTERVLHLVVGVARRDVEPRGQVDVLDAGLLVGDAGGHELRGVDELADDVGLPADELGDELGLEAAPGQVVLRLEVAVGPPQVRPRREPVGPVDETPLLVEPLDGAVAVPQPVDEPLEDALVVQQPQAGLVVDLVADDRRVLAVAGDDRADDPLGVEQVRRVGEVDLLARAPADRLARRALARDLRDSGA